MQNTVKTVIGRALGAVGLRNVARRIESTMRPGGFRAESPITLEAVERALGIVGAQGLADRGDYYEFGIFRGYTLWYAQQLMNRLGYRSMRVVGFDSFEGLPEVSGVDDYKGDFSKGQYAASLAYVRDQLTKHGVDWQRTILVPGYFEATLNAELKRELALRPAATVLIDCDLYESARLALGFIGDLLLDGAIVIFDDWNAFDRDDDRGERRAFREFLAGRPDIAAEALFDYGTHGKAFRVARTGSAHRAQPG
jgi:hypothetical protein